MKNSFLITILFFELNFLGCSPKVTIKSTSNSSSDFSYYRHQFEYERETYNGFSLIEEVYLPFDSTVQHYDITKTLDKTLDNPINSPTNICQIDCGSNGFRIQIYRGKSREEASKARRRSYELFPNLTPYFIYSSPNYRVRVGDFLKLSECEILVKKIKKEFPDAILVPEMVKLRD